MSSWPPVRPVADSIGAIPSRTRRRRVLWVLIDGGGDVAVPALGGRTPMQAAALPTLDEIARVGVLGLLDPVEPGLACGSDTAHMAMFGYEPRQHYRGRGAFESMGAGLAMQPGDIAFKSNFATLDEATGVVLRRRADRNFEGLGPALCAALDGLCVCAHACARARVWRARAAEPPAGPDVCRRSHSTAWPCSTRPSTAAASVCAGRASPTRSPARTRSRTAGRYSCASPRKRVPRRRSPARSLTS
eukprot:Unigene12986_Nuclearia_a/m.39396 Unigene12986_Nuclearia_a/g.39396  ORF Unigene12986_Nuclearia_a/g.39396 Unigene12986_Nuclearia_a/m.39396 type:complete len:246 (-) Unigene12986_Nuclearia_a:689-1426(-)